MLKIFIKISVKYLLLFTSCYFLSIAVKAQEKPVAETISLAYFGEYITHPGIAVNLERNLSTTQHFDVFLNGELGGYVHTRNHTGFFLDIQSGYRFKMHSGLFFDQAIGLGYLRTFLHGGNIFGVSKDRQVYEVKNSGRGHIMPLIKLGTGYDFSAKHNGSWLVFARLRFFWQYPFNNYSLVHPAVEAGISKAIKWER